MENDTLQAMVDSLSQTAQSTTGTNIWMIVAIVELVIIIVLLMTRKPTDNKRSNIKKNCLLNVILTDLHPTQKKWLLPMNCRHW